MSRLFAFGLGFSAQELAPRLAARGWSIAGTARDNPKIARLKAQGYEVAQFAADEKNPELTRLLEGTTHLLHSIPPGAGGDRVVAEQDWLAFGEEIGVPAHVFRLAGIYGPGRSVFDKLASGTASRINKNGQVFSRIHVEDIANVLEASIARPRAGAIYNVADDEPAAPGDIVAHAAEMIGVEPPPEVDFEDADLSPMARTFYEGSRRIANDLIKSELGVKLRYPTFREGLAALRPADS
jgi:nucleoside-diphosphate-sugar epimerase